MIFKKALGAVVATSLLITIAVATIFGFQSWYQTFSSETFSDIDQKASDSSSTSGIETIVGSNIYFKNGYDNITITSVKIGDNDCEINGSYDGGIKSLPLGNNCTMNLRTSTPDVMITTDKGVFVKKIYLKNAEVSSSQTTTSSLDCSGLNGGEWIAVPGNAALGTSDFCVMKYEAKSDGTTNCGGGACPISQAASTPWIFITQINSKIKCENLGAGYHLITNAEWTTIARNAEQVATNWDSGTVGSGSMWRGHSDGSPNNALAVTNTADYYDGTGNSAPSIERRVLELNNLEVIWDLGGNVWEWNNDTCSQGDPWYTLGWEWTDANINGPEKSLAGPVGAYTSINGVGQYYGCTTNGNAFLRGGSWLNGANAGTFALNLDGAPSHSYTYGGFRCSYTP